LLPNGSVVVAGGFLNGPGELFSAEIFDPATNGWSLLTNQLTYARWGHTATLLPSGQTLFAGGVGASGDLASTEALDSDNVTASPTANMKFPVVDHTATLLTGGQVLVTGGSTTNLGVYASATMYTLSGAWIQSITVTTPKRYGHTATLLVDGNVLVAGGADSIFPSHPATNSAAICVFSGLSWTATGSMNTGRIRHTATLLLSGKVLVAGGDPGVAPAPCETYDPATGLWTQTGAMNIRRSRHTATLLPDGKVLVVGGYGTPLVESLYPISELYDPATGVWTTNTARSTYLSGHTATLLQSGKVLVVFGYEAARGGPTIDATAIYDPVTATWTATRGPNVARYNHTATLLPNGKVLIVGGSSDLYGDLSDAETYDPVAGIWTTVGSMTDPRARHTATLLPNGRVLIAGGEPGPVNTAELYDVGLGFSSAWQPHIFSFPFSVGLGSNFTTSGFYLRGFSEAAGGNTQNSASDHPVIQLLSIGSERTLFLSSTNWSGHHFNSRPLFNFPPGIAIATVFVNGIPGPAAALFRVALPVPTPPTLMTSTKPGNGSFHFTFTNSPGAVFGALATTNPALPLSNWTAISGVTEISPGQFQFTDSQSTNSKRFYRVRAL
jgi:N-acetylneuraminic acid mutarotase